MAGKKDIVDLVSEALRAAMRALPEKDAMALSRTGSDPKRFLPYTGSFQKKSSPSFYDPKYWAVEPDHLEYPEGVIVGTRDKLVPVAPSTNASNLIKPDNELMYRGMSADEMVSFLRSQELKSRGDYNLSGQEGLTYFTKDPEAAEYYANAFAPEKYKPDMEKPAYVVAAKRPPSSRIVDVPGTASHELGVTGSVPVEDVVGVYRGTTTDYTPVWRDNGSYSAPNARLNWEEKSLDDILRGRASGGRTGYGPGGAIDDIVKMAGKIVSGADEPAKTGIRAYHGTPHDFDKFDIGKIGTGEGAQAYGHGLYFAEKEGVAKGYRDALAPKLQPKEAGAWIAKTGGDKEEAARQFMEAMGSGNPKIAEWERVNRPEAWAENMRMVDAIRNYNPGKMYEVNIAADPDQFLDWDKPLSEQSETVKGILARLPGAPDQSVWPYTTGNDLYEQLRVDAMGDDAFMQATPQRLAARKAAAPEITRVLGETGIPGIKYLDAGSRNKGVAQVQVMYKGQPHGDPIPAHAWNQVDQLVNDYKAKGYDTVVQDLGTRNYVVFDDKLISIIRKYGIAGASAMLGYNLMEQLDPKQALAASMADQDYQSSRPQRSMGGNNSVSGALNVARGLQGGM